MSEASRQPLLDRRTLLMGAGAWWLAACSSGVDVSLDQSSDSAESPGSSAAAQVTSVEADSSTAGPEEGTAPPDAQTQPVEAQPEVEAQSEVETQLEVEAQAPASGYQLTAADFAGLAICSALPESTTGPFPTIAQLDRRDVTEGYPGQPLHLGLRVVNDGCVPIDGAHVEIWHADASGDYSSYDDNGDGKDEGAGTTFLRGFQTTNADGIADFITIYPGWYRRRAVHIHVRVAVGGANVLTAQLYFDEEYTEQVFATGPYAEFGLPDTSWSRDRIVGDPTKDGTGITLAAADTELGPGTLGLANIGVSL